MRRIIKDITNLVLSPITAPMRATRRLLENSKRREREKQLALEEYEYVKVDFYDTNSVIDEIIDELEKPKSVGLNFHEFIESEKTEEEKNREIRTQRKLKKIREKNRVVLFPNDIEIRTNKQIKEDKFIKRRDGYVKLLVNIINDNESVVGEIEGTIEGYKISISTKKTIYLFRFYKRHNGYHSRSQGSIHITIDGVTKSFFLLDKQNDKIYKTMEKRFNKKSYQLFVRYK